MKLRKYLYLSLAVSLAIHLGFLVASMHVQILGMYQKLVQTPFFKVNPESALTTSKKTVQGDRVTPIETLPATEPTVLKEISEFIQMQEQRVVKEPMPIVADNPVEMKVTDALRPSMDSPKAVTFSQKTPRPVRKTLVKAITVDHSQATVEADSVAGRMEVPELFQNQMPGFTPPAVGDVKLSVSPGDKYSIERTFSPLVSRKSSVGNLKEYLVSELLRYEDPKTGERFFRLSIRTGKDAQALKARPKEIIFLIDASNSIEATRLAGFQEGVKYALNHLNPQDRFNVIAFKDGIVRFRDNPISVDASEIKKAIKFIDFLVVGKRTDTYNALYKAINIQTPFSPSYVMVLSDGRPTQGIVDSGKLIQEISQANNGRISIFAFSGGVWVNRYLLDFIAYKNRGWAEHSYREHLIDENFKKMYDKIRDPILVNVRFHVSGVKDAEVFPKMLPDFFRDAEFTLYGRYEKGEPLVLQLLGDVDNQSHEFIVEANLEDAKVGEPTIARDWAFNKIYYLIGLLQHDQDNQSILDKIRDLSKQFKIETPYLDWNAQGPENSEKK